MQNFKRFQESYTIKESYTIISVISEEYPFSHLGMDGISKLLNENMVEGMTSTKDGDLSDVCEACAMGK